MLRQIGEAGWFPASLDVVRRRAEHAVAVHYPAHDDIGVLVLLGKTYRRVETLCLQVNLAIRQFERYLNVWVHGQKRRKGRDQLRFAESLRRRDPQFAARHIIKVRYMRFSVLELLSHRQTFEIEFLTFRRWQDAGPRAVEQTKVRVILQMAHLLADCGWRLAHRPRRGRNAPSLAHGGADQHLR